MVNKVEVSRDETLPKEGESIALITGYRVVLDILQSSHNVS